MKTSHILIAIVIVAVTGLGLAVYQKFKPMDIQAPIISQPEPIVEPELTGSNASEVSDLIIATEPKVGQLVSSPMRVYGQARGYWFFEASFPYKVYDANGKELAHSFIMTPGEWMTEDFIPFDKMVDFTTPETDTGTLVLMKDNPSELPEHDNQLVIPIRFK